MSQALVAKIGVQLGRFGSLRARFVQTNTLIALKMPLVSRGTLLVLRGQGVIWSETEPLRATYVMTGAKALKLDAEGHRTQGSPRGMADVSRILAAMLDGDLSGLYERFDVQAEGSEQQWRMHLVPNDPQVAQVVQEMRLEGADTLHTLMIRFRSGDELRIAFTDTVAVREAAPAEADLLDSARS